MKLCDICDNMMYIKVTKAQLQYSCKNCGNTVDGGDDPCIISTNFVDDQTTYKQFATPYIAHDPTLPRVSNVPCPNTECTRPDAVAPEVIYVKYDHTRLRYLYHCVHCGTFWKAG